MKAITWAIRVTFTDGHSAFLRTGGLSEGGGIMTFHTKEAAESRAAALRERPSLHGTVTVIERSHGRRLAESSHPTEPAQ